MRGKNDLLVLTPAGDGGTQAEPSAPMPVGRLLDDGLRIWTPHGLVLGPAVLHAMGGRGAGGLRESPTHRCPLWLKLGLGWRGRAWASVWVQRDGAGGGRAES